MSQRRRALPRALFHITTERGWKKIQRDGVLKQGKGYGWEERSGVFSLGWHNWLTTRSLHYLSFLTIKLTRKDDKLVVLRIDMTPELWDRTKVALLTSGTETSRLLLEKAKAGCFSNVRAEDVLTLKSYEDTLVRNMFDLREFVREIPASDDRVEYITECEVPLALVSKVAEIAKCDIPASIIKSGRRLARNMRRYKGQPPKGKRPAPLVTAEDKEVFIRRLLASRQKLVP